MAGVEDGAVIVFCSLVQAVAAGFAVSHLQPETEGETPWLGGGSQRPGQGHPVPTRGRGAGWVASTSGKCELKEWLGQPGLSTPRIPSPSLALSASPGPVCTRSFHTGWGAWVPLEQREPRGKGGRPPRQHRPG